LRKTRTASSGFRDGTSKKKNFFTSPGKRGSNGLGATFGRYPEHISDPYERRDELRRQHRARQNGKMLGGPSFKSMSRGGHDFGNRGDESDGTPITAIGLRPLGHSQSTGNAHQNFKPWMPTSPETKN
jgi:hypothetical protein